MLIQKLSKLFAKSPKPQPTFAPKHQQKTKVRHSLSWRQRFVYVMLLLICEFSQVLTPFAYAQQNVTPPPLAPTQSKSTLLTSNSSSGALPFMGTGSGVDSIIPSFTNTASSNLSADVRVPAKVRKLIKKNYRPNEQIAVVIDNGASDTYKTELVDANGVKVAVATENVVTGDTKTIKVSQPSSFRPGKYKLRISNSTGGVSEQDFTWGVLAINPDKSVYTPGETANLAIAVLSDKGDMVCDATVDLEITNPAGTVTTLSTDNQKITVNPECLSHDFTLNPDYQASYQIGGTGTYNMSLTATSPNGNYTISDSFQVRTIVPFAVKRVTATRIYPPHTYPVTMEITANQDFNGTVSETVPASFQVANPGQNISPSNQFDPMASGSAEASSGVQSPEPVTVAIPTSPQASNAVVTAYNTISNLPTLSDTPNVLGASIPGIGLPFAGNFPVTQGFGESLVNIHDESLYTDFGMKGHDGIDFGTPLGTSILSVDAGTVIQAGPGDYGTTVIVQHSWGESYYGHLSQLGVKVGDQVLRGSPVGLSGNTGITTGPHLHFGIRPNSPDMKNGYYGKVDPAYYLGMKQSAANVLGASTKLADAVNPKTEISAPVSTDVQILTWKINVKKGDKIKIGYNYLAPRISPQFYTLGPATFIDTTGKRVFQEERKWQIAADAMDLKMKQGQFLKSTCTASCTQAVTGIGFKPKAIIFRWTSQTTEGYTPNQFTGMGIVTRSGGTQQGYAVSYWSEDAQATSDTGRINSDNPIDMQSTNGNVLAAAGNVTFDNDGFTLTWDLNDTNADLIQYTAIGGADVSNAKVGTFNLSTGAGSQAVTDPGFKPDFLITMATGPDSLDVNTANGKMSIGYAASASKQGAFTMLARDAQATAADTYRQQRTDSNILLLTDTGTQDAIANLTSMDATGFTLNKSDPPASITPIFYLALQGGQYDVGSLTQPTSNGTQSIINGFKPSGTMLMSDNTTAQTGIISTAALSIGGAAGNTQSKDAWCNATSSVTCNTSWTNRRKISIDNTNSASTLQNFPVLVKLDSTRIDYNKTQNSGQDIRFVDPSNPSVVLPYQIESWNEAGSSYVWVKVPKLSPSGNNYLWMYYGNTSASDGQTPTSVWDSNFIGVWHAGENPAGTAPQIKDSTSNGNNGTAQGGMVSGNSISAIVGNGLSFGSSRSIRFGDIAATHGIGQYTLSGWVKQNASGTGIFLGKESNACTDALDMEVNGGFLYYQSGVGSSYASGRITYSTADTGWHFVTLVFNGSNTGSRTTGYLDGVQQTLTSYSDGTSTVTTSNTTSTNIAEIGATGGACGDSFANQSSDEVRMSNTSRSSDWIEAEYLTETDAMNTYGPEETQNSVANTISEGSIWSDDRDNEATENANMSDTSTKAIRMATSAAGGATPSSANAEADLQSFDPTGFTLNWTTTDATARQVLYWAAGSANASEEDYRWYKNTNGITPITAMQGENQPAILAANKPYARLRANVSASGNGLNASAQGFKLQYTSNNAPAGTNDTNPSDWCNATSGVTCTAPSTSSGWPYRRKITFDNAASSSNLTNFPVLVKLDSTRIDYNKVQSAGQDIRFVDPSDPTTVLPHEIESWNPGGTSYVWVKVPQIDSGSTTDSIWMYYGNSAVSDGQQATSVWDANTIMTQHLEESSACPVTFSDSTSNGINGSCNGSGPTANANGKIGNARKFNGSNQYISASNNTNFNPGSGAFSGSAWIYTTNTNLYQNIMAHLTPSGTPGWEFYIDTTNRIALFDSSASREVSAGLTANTWQHVAFVKSGTTVTFYVNGVSVGSSTAVGTVASYTGNETFGYDQTGPAPTSNFNGSMEELRYYNTARSADWIKAEYLTGNDSMNSYGQEQPYTQGSTNTVGWTDVGDPWCNATSGVTCTTAWTTRRRVTFNNTASSSNLSNFPVLIKLDSNRINYANVQSAGQDIRFVDPSNPNVVLPHEIESWNSSGTSYVWVKVPQIDANSATDSIWMYYGNAGASDGQQASSVWDSNFASVLHMNQTSGTTLNDSTTNGNNGTKASTTNVASSTTGQIGNAQTFAASGTTSYVTLPDSTLLHAITQSNYTLSAWVDPASLPPSNGHQDYFIVGKNGFHTGPTYSQNFFYAQLWDNTGPNYYEVDGPNTSTPGNWYLVTQVVDNTAKTLSIYVNGVFASTTPYTGTPYNYGTTQMSIGQADFSDTCSDTVGYPFCFKGQIDEVEISNTNRSADWLRAQYLTEDDQMNTYGPEETQSTAVWKFKVNSLVTNGTTLTTALLSSSAPSGSQQTYQENNYMNNASAIAAGEKREWDFSLDGTAARKYTTYYFRIVSADGTPLTNYTRYPTLTIGPALEKTMRHGQWFNYASAQPFTF